MFSYTSTLKCGSRMSNGWVDYVIELMNSPKPVCTKIIPIHNQEHILLHSVLRIRDKHQFPADLWVKICYSSVSKTGEGIFYATGLKEGRPFYSVFHYNPRSLTHSLWNWFIPLKGFSLLWRNVKFYTIQNYSFWKRLAPCELQR